MPYINKFTFGLLNVYALKQAQANNGHFAVLMRRLGHQNDAPQLHAVGRQPLALPGWSTHTAIVNAIQRQAQLQQPLSNLIVFSTHPPTDACKGMMKTHGLHSVSWIAAQGPRWMDVRNQANVAQMVAANLPATQGPNRMQLPGNAMAPDHLLQDPSDVTQAATARTWIQQLTQVNHQRVNPWRQTWPAGHLATARRHMGVRHLPGTLNGQVGQAFADAVYMLFVFAIAGQVRWQGTPGARIVGLLASRRGEIYGWQLNQRQFNTTFHAETNLIQGLGQGIPADATLYSTLEPCHQCAGLYVKAGGARCVFGQNDPNMTGNTALGNTGILFNRATYVHQHLPDLTVGQRLDQIVLRSTVAAQAARAAQLMNQGQTMNQATQAVGNIQARVLDILNTTPAHELYRQSRGVLANLIGIVRGNRQPGHPVRVLIENVALPLGL